MISAESITKFFRKNTAITLILALALFLRLSKINSLFPFDYDQQVVAESAYDLFVNHKITLIGQELSFEGFFLGPLHNWVGSIPYGICNLKPDCTPYFFAFLGMNNILILFLVLKRIFSNKIAIIASSIYTFSFAAISSEIGVNSNFFLPLASTLLLYCFFRYISGKNHYFTLGAFIAGVATVNFNPVFIFSSLAFFISGVFVKTKKNLWIYAAPLAFLINYIPLLIFNIRHQNILTENLGIFLSETTAQNAFLERFIFLTNHVSLPYLSNFLFNNSVLFYFFLTTSLLTLGIFLSFKKRNPLNTFLLLWLVLPLVGFTFYKGHTPDYYFMQSLLPFIIFVSQALTFRFAIFLFASFFILFLNIQRFVHFTSNNNFRLKSKVVNEVLRDTQETSFNVYYQMPPGINTGYSYLLKISGKPPHEGSRNLYILHFSDPTTFPGYKYYFTYPNKEVSFKQFGFIQLVSVK